jgi:hypothetical protein
MSRFDESEAPQNKAGETHEGSILEINGFESQFMGYVVDAVR